MMAFQAGGPHAQDRGLEADRLRVGGNEANPRARLLGETAGQERAAEDGKAFPDRAARRRARDRLLHVSDVERVSRLLRRPRHRQRGGRQAASGGDSSARAPRQDCARGAVGGGLRSERRDARRARARRCDRADARAAGGGPAHRFHRQLGERQLARGERAARAGVHGEVRRQPDRHRLDRRLQGGRAQHRLFARALHRADVHRAAEHLRAEGWHRHRRRAPDVRSGRRGHRRSGAEAPRRPGACRRDPRRGRQRRRDAAARGGAKARPDRARYAVDRSSARIRRRGSVRRSW